MHYVYIMSNKRHGTLYIGTTRNLVGSFTEKYNLNKLVYYEEYSFVMNGVTREKQMKKWRRIWKINLIEAMNPNWEDLAADWYE